MDAYAIVSSEHGDTGDGWCACGESAADCWWLRIYRPYRDLCADRFYADVFAEVPEERTDSGKRA